MGRRAEKQVNRLLESLFDLMFGKTALKIRRTPDESLGMFVREMLRENDDVLKASRLSSIPRE